jgi:hypothetical protein
MANCIVRAGRYPETLKKMWILSVRVKHIGQKSKQMGIATANCISRVKADGNERKT